MLRAVAAVLVGCALASPVAAGGPARASAAASAATAAPVSPSPSTTPTAAPACPDFEFLGARGSGEDNQFGNTARYTTANPTFGMGGELNDVYQRVATAAKAAGVTITPYGVPYPAVGIDVVGSATLASGDFSVYTKSVELGAHAAAAEMARVARSCPSTGLIVAGYSQGAQAVVDAALSATPSARARIVAAVFFGNTYFDSSASDDDYGSYEPGLDGYLMHSGALPASAIGPNGPISGDWRKAFGTAPIFDYCHSGDPICGLVDQRTINGKSYPVRDFAHIVAVNSIGAENPSILTQHTDYTGADTANAAQQLKSLLGLPMRATDASNPAVLTTPDSATVGTPAPLNGGGSLSDPANPVISYRWTAEVGAGERQSWSTRSPRTSVTFLTPGPHRVSLTTSTASGATSTSSGSVTAAPAPLAAPTTPTKVSAVAGDGAAALTWPEVPGAEFYVVRDGGKLLTAFTPLVPGQSPVSWTDTGLKNGTERDYRVYAVNSMGASAGSALVKVAPHASHGTVAPPVSLRRPTTTLVDPELAWSLGLGLIVVAVGAALVKESPRPRRRRLR